MFSIAWNTSCTVKIMKDVLTKQELHCTMNTEVQFEVKMTSVW
jgi:hypothetical protein